ncbi:hypothetical protein [Clostridium sp. MCC353]|uniref:hypothetical protein n=1 Tax=Clostridium sp. MCC353 TaxID=2592646 RepID=UPI0031FEE171
MKLLKGDHKRDFEIGTFFVRGEYRYSLEPFYGKLPDFLRFTPFSGGCCDKEDNLFLVTRDWQHPVVMLDKDGNYVRDFGKGLFQNLHTLCVTEENTLLCVDSDRHVVREIDVYGGLIRDIGQLDTPSDSGHDGAVWQKMQRSGELIATDIRFNSDWAFVEGLKTIKRAAEPFNRPTGVSISPKGDIFVSDGYCNAAVHKFSKNGELLMTWGGPGNEPGKFVIPHGIWVDKFCRVWVADREGNSVHIFSEEGELLGYMKEGLYQPSDLWSDGTYVYIGERGGQITMIDMDLNIVSQLGFYNSPLRTHGICGTASGELILMPLHSYDGIYLMKLKPL